ncbi:esterase/lipase family protein [Novosphingobium cyanobacteriorum]|uniref:Alpha/beta hydrolase n=1 Tax=Novosphingobium cyanobacteriorum TaxID=3024215 RepID=A0ABT6CFH0_9SPHN|nr:alpha/beta hydrolase [Novosphingobium cyanobacteriorum]MDF8332661.1 alpha/beta hydrolase [Novosphingobium cyanobacteriorum]
MAVVQFKRRQQATAAPMRARQDIRRPFLGWTMLESARFMMEAGTLALSWPLLFSAPRGDGHPVMVLPGFATNDTMTALLRQFLSTIGYDVHPWDLGWNLDQHSAGENGEHVARRIEEIATATGQRVSLVGWSLGGVIAREAARREGPDGALRQVITLGSPFTGNPKATSLNAMYELLTGNKVSSMQGHARYARGHHPLPVPSTAIFSRSDGITAWENCVSETDAQTENVEVHCSHFGFVANPAVFYAVADRLALAEGEWRPFDRSGPFAAFYP